MRDPIRKIRDRRVTPKTAPPRPKMGRLSFQTGSKPCHRDLVPYLMSDYSLIMRILLVEDDADLAATICEYLNARGVAVDHASDGLSGLEMATSTSPDAVVLDIGLPGISGHKLCAAVREQWKLAVPILMLTARGALEDKIEGFRAGADDYLVKPFALAELMCRLEALVRRGRKDDGRVWKVGDLEVNVEERTATRRGVPLRLTKLEFDILATLCAARPAAVGHRDLARRVWGEEHVEPETIRAHIYQLRRVVDRPFETPLLHTIRGFGHVIKEAHA